MNVIQELLKPEYPSVSEKKVFEYPFLFNIKPDGDSDISMIELDKINCDCVFESLVPVSCDIFKKTFRWKKTTDCLYLNDMRCEPINVDKMECNVSKNIVESTSQIKKDLSLASLETYEWIYDVSWITQMSDEFKRIFEGNMVPVGQSFTENPLFYGAIGNYYIQYLANGLFGHPNAVVCIQNQREITTGFTNLYTHITEQLTDFEQFKQFADKLRRVFIEAEPERWETDKQLNDFPFKQGDILEFFIKIHGSIHFPSHTKNIQIQQTWMNLINQSNICDESGILCQKVWKIRFILL